MARAPRAVTTNRRPKRDPAQQESRVVVGDVSQVHPDLVDILPDYTEMRDASAGASSVKRRGETYLPKPSGFAAQSDGGSAMYESYKTRAQFPEIMSPTILGMIGIIHKNEFQIAGLDEGSPLAHLWEKATPDGLTLEGLSRRVTKEIMTIGRVVMLADAPANGGDPYIALYRGESLINWSESRDFFVLEEQRRIRTGYSWAVRKCWRVLELVDGEYVQRQVDESGRTADVASVSTPAGTTDITREQELEGGETGDGSFAVTAKGGLTLDAIPIVVGGSRDLSLEPDEIPLAGVARSALAIYRLDADYRHQLFMSGQDTLFISGIDKEDIPAVVGAGVAVAIPTGATANYVGPGGKGIDAHAKAIGDEREVAAAAGARVFDASPRGAESGEALKIRARASTATLASVALSSAATLEAVLRHCGRIAGMQKSEIDAIVVTPDLNFLASRLTPIEAKSLVDVWMTGAISYQTLYDNLQSGEIASPERTAEEEQELAAKEQSAAAEDEAAVGDEDLALPDPDGDPFEEDISDEELKTMFDPELLSEVGIGPGAGVRRGG